MSKCHRFRKRKSSTTQRPRLCVYKSNLNVYAQIIDDTRGHTLASASTLQLDAKGNISGAEAVGKKVAEDALKLSVKAVSFDRGGRRYTGQIKALADAARKAGLEF